jgi:ferredoxin
MDVSADQTRCQGHGRCNLLAPDIFDLDESGHVVTLVSTVPERLRDDAREAVANCPEQAISVS